MRTLGSVCIKYILPAIVLLACAKPISLDHPRQEPKLTIEGWIEPGQSARVLLTMSTGFNTTIDSSSYLSIVQTKAKVWIENEDDVEILTLIEDSSFFPPHLYKSRKTIGAMGEIYTIHVEYAESSAEGTTQILNPVALDSAWFQIEKGQDSLGIIWLKWKDPAYSDDYFRLQTKVRGSDRRFIGCQISAVKDISFNGKEISYPIYKGYASLSDKLEDHRFKIGDTVDIRFSKIGEAEYLFWNSYDNSVLNAGNPFSTGGENLPSNISGGVGIWTGYGSTYATVVCK